MKHTLKKFFCFILPLLIVFSLAQAGWIEIYGEKRNEYLQKLERIDNEVKGVVLGDSHPDSALDRSSLPTDVVKLTFGSDSFNEMYLKLNYLIRKDVELDFLVLPLDYNSFSQYRSYLNNRDKMLTVSNITQYNKLYQTDVTIIEKKIKRYVPVLIPENASNLTQYTFEYFKRKLKEIVLGSTGSSSKQEKTWSNLTMEQKFNQAESRVEGQFKGGYINESMWAAFNKILRTCKNKNIKIIGVRYPVTKVYHNQTPKKFINEVNSRIQNSDLYKVLDFSELYWGQEKYFANQDHLNKKGRENFTPTFLKKLSSIVKIALPKVGSTP